MIAAWGWTSDCPGSSRATRSFIYNLACSYSLNGEVDLAASALEKSLALGYQDFKWLAKDPDLRSLRQHPLYRTIEAKIRKMKIKIS